LEAEAAAKTCGSTASIAILHSLDTPSTPFFSAQKMALTVAHVGCVIFRYSPRLRTETCGRRSDTRIILCSTNGGTAHLMTENHRAEGRVESVRLRRMMGTGVIADSFGDSRWVCSIFHGTRMPILAGRWMGALENTRRCVRRLADGRPLINS